MLIKVPRNIDRRDVMPGMDLYDYIIGMYDDHLYLLEGKGKEVEEIKIPYGENEGVENFINLLLGRLTIYLKDRKIQISYNAVSKNIITEVIKIIRSNYAIKSYEILKTVFNQNEDLESLYVSLLHDMKLSGDHITISTAQPAINVKPINQTFVQK